MSDPQFFEGGRASHVEAPHQLHDARDLPVETPQRVPIELGQALQPLCLTPIQTGPSLDQPLPDIHAVHTAVLLHNEILKRRSSGPTSMRHLHHSRTSVRSGGKLSKPFLLTWPDLSGRIRPSPTATWG